MCHPLASRLGGLRSIWGRGADPERDSTLEVTVPRAREARASCPLLLVLRSPSKHLWVNMAYLDFYTWVLRVLWAYV